MKILYIVLLVLALLVLIGWLGLQVKPKPFSMPSLPTSAVRSVPLPDGMPKPVEQFYKTVYGEQIPVIDTIVITGRGRINPFGIWLPARFVFVHNTGRDYRHYFEATFFGLPFLRVNEGYIDSESFFESPMGTYYNDPNTNQSANLALWAEGGWFAAIWLTDPRVQWEAVDDNTALLHVPYEDQIETFTVHFNPETRLIDKSEVMRFKNPGDKEKILWVTNTSEDGRTSYATWMDVGKPWAELTLEQITFNMDVSSYIRERGQ
jgi:hypothetical protein